MIQIHRFYPIIITIIVKYIIKLRHEASYFEFKHCQIGHLIRKIFYTETTQGEKKKRRIFLFRGILEKLSKVLKIPSYLDEFWIIQIDLKISKMVYNIHQRITFQLVNEKANKRVSISLKKNNLAIDLKMLKNMCFDSKIFSISKFGISTYYVKDLYLKSFYCSDTVNFIIGINKLQITVCIFVVRISHSKILIH